MSENAAKPSQWFYEALPYLYVGTGLLVALALPNLWGAFSGALLVSAGALVWNMRRRHRHLARLRQDQRSRKAAQINAARQRDWRRAMAESQRFADDVLRWLERPDPALVQPL